MSDSIEASTREELLQSAIARRELADQARELARGIVNEFARQSLLAHADELDEQAAVLEAEADRHGMSGRLE